MQVTTLGSELSVLLPVKIANATLEMILDSGAGPSVIDLGTIRDLGLEKRVIRRVGRVYGVGQNPVELFIRYRYKISWILEGMCYRMVKLYISHLSLV